MRPSKIISIILHPVFMPLLLFYIIIEGSTLFYYLTQNSLLYTYFMLLLFTVLLPIISILIKIKIKLVSSLELIVRGERPLALLSSLFWFLCGYYFLIPIFYTAPILKQIYIGGLLILLISVIISKFWKISLHLLSVGGATGVFLGLEKIHNEFLFFALLFILLSGLLAYARLKEGAHNHTQLYIGFLIGVVVEYLCII